MIPDRIPPSKDECPTSSRTAQSREIDDVMGKGPTGKIDWWRRRGRLRVGPTWDGNLHFPSEKESMWVFPSRYHRGAGQPGPHAFGVTWEDPF
eukprot:scaffold1144_cov378-Pavlova_lutheri.AAC.1